MKQKREKEWRTADEKTSQKIRLLQLIVLIRCQPFDITFGDNT